MRRTLTAIGMLLSTTLWAQHNNEFYNDGAEVTVQNGAEMYVMGDFHNYQATGLLTHDGFIEIQGHVLSDNQFQQRGTGTTLITNVDVNAGQTQYIQGSYAVRGGQSAIGVNDGSFYDLELANDQGIVWLNGTGNIADVRNSVNFSGTGAPLVNRIITHDPSALPANGSGYVATFGLMNPAPGTANLISNSVAIGGNSSGIDQGYIQGNFRRAILSTGGIYNYVLGLEPAGAGAQRGMQYIHLDLAANNYDVISGFFETGLDNTFPVATECSGYIMSYYGGVDHGQWVMSDITGSGTGVYTVQMWPQDDNFPGQSVWMITKDNSIQGTANVCGPTPVGLSRSGFAGMGQFGAAATSILLPAELLHISASPNVDHIEIDWTVGSEFNLDYYELQRSENGIDFQTVATIDAVGTTQEEQQYAYADYGVTRNKNYYYRYQSVDNDFYTEYSPIVSAQITGSDNFSESMLLYPNPTNGNVFVDLNLELKSEISMVVLNNAGQNVEVKQFSGNAGNNVFTLDAASWASGVYIVELTEKRTGETVRKRIVKN